jgi:hypothetical protein
VNRFIVYVIRFIDYVSGFIVHVRGFVYYVRGLIDCVSGLNNVCERVLLEAEHLSPFIRVTPALNFILFFNY